MIRFLISILLLTPVVIALAAEEPLAFKSLPLGATRAEVLKHYPRAKCKGNHCLAELNLGTGSSESLIKKFQEQSLSMSVGGVVMSKIEFGIFDDKLDTISMWPDSSSFDRLATALRDRYGKPTENLTAIMRTRAGVEYENRILAWRRVGGVIKLKRYDFNIDKSSLTYSSDRAIEREGKLADEMRKRAAKNL